MKIEDNPNALSANVTFEDVEEMHAVYGGQPFLSRRHWYSLLSRIPGLTSDAYPRTVEVPHTALGRALGYLATSEYAETSDPKWFRELEAKHVMIANQLAEFFRSLRRDYSRQ